MNIFERLFLSATTKAALSKQNNTYMVSGGIQTSPSDNTQSYIDKGYNMNDTLYSVIKIILDKIRVSPWGVYKVQDEQSLKRYQSEISKKNFTPKELNVIKDLRRKALVPITDSSLQVSKLKELMKFPNENESWGDFVNSGMLQKLLTGNKYVYAQMLNEGANSGIPNQLFVLPTSDMTLEINTTFPSSVVGYKMLAYSQDFERVEIMHEKYANPTWSLTGEQHYGLSPLKAAINGTLSRNNSAVKASTSQYANRGIEDIIFLDTSNDRDVREGTSWANTMKQKIKSEWVGERNAGKIEVSPYPIGSVKLGLSAKEMQLIEAEKWDVIKFCNIYGVPPALVTTDAMTLNNVQNAEKALTTRCALPELISFRDSLNFKLKTDWGFKDKNIFIDFDSTVYSELASDMNEIATWCEKIKWLTPNQILDAIGYEQRDEREFNEVWITPQMGQPYSEFKINEVEAAIQQGSNDSLSGNG